MSILYVCAGAFLVTASLACAYFWEGISTYRHMNRYYSGKSPLRYEIVPCAKKHEEGA